MASMCNKHHIFIVLLVIIASILPIKCREISRASLREKHEQWMSRYGREYKDIIEKEERYTIFKANVEYIDSINNAGDIPYRLSLNQFADKTNEEFKSTYLSHGNPSKTKSSSANNFSHENVTDIPPRIDWRKKGAVTPIRDTTCGAWTLPSVDTVEGITKIKSGTLYTLSVQEIVDCYNGGENNGCTGGLLSNAFDFIKEKGLTTESNYPSKENTGKCDKKKEAEPVAKISSYEYVLADNEVALMKAVAEQPVAVSVDASGQSFQFYSSGVFTGQCGTELDHGVTIVGYGTDENGKLIYWIIKNSWGTTWGEDGYMRLQKDVSQKEGLCGVAMEALYPVV